MPESKLQSILDHAFQMKRDGKSTAEILALFPDHHGELKEFLETISAIRYGTNNIKPSALGLTKTLTKMKFGPVTKNSRVRYISEKELRAGRPLAIKLSLNQIFNMFKNRLAILIPIGAIALLLVFVGFRMRSTGTLETNASPATVDGAATAITDDAAAEDNLLASESDETIGGITAENQDIIDLGQTYDENQL